MVDRKYRSKGVGMESYLELAYDNPNRRGYVYDIYYKGHKLFWDSEDGNDTYCACCGKMLNQILDDPKQWKDRNRWLSHYETAHPLELECMNV